MSTRCRVGYLNDDGTVDSIYVHNDGFIDGVGAALADEYTDAAKVRVLVDEGDHSTISGKVESYRSLGESIEETASKHDANARDFYESAAGDNCDFAYLFDPDSSEWLVGTKRLNWKPRPLAVDLPPP